MAFDVLNVLLYGGNKSVQKKCLDVIFEIDRDSFTQKITKKFELRFFYPLMQKIKQTQELNTKHIVEGKEQSAPEDKLSQLSIRSLQNFDDSLLQLYAPRKISLFKIQISRTAKHELNSFFGFFHNLIADQFETGKLYFCSSTETKVEQTTDILTYTVNCLETCLLLNSEKLRQTTENIIDFLKETVKGPSKPNQRFLVYKTKLLSVIKTFINEINYDRLDHAHAAKLAADESEHSLELLSISQPQTRSIARKLLHLVHLLAEGSNESKLVEQIYEDVNIEALVKILKEEYIHFKHVSMNEIKEKRAFDIEDVFWFSEDFKENFFIYFTIDQACSRSNQLDRCIKKLQQNDEAIRTSTDFFCKYTRKVEIEFEEKLTFMYFIINRNCLDFRSKYISTVKDHTHSQKLVAFIGEFPKFFAEIDRNQFMWLVRGFVKLPVRLDEYLAMFSYLIVIEVLIRTLFWSNATVRNTFFENDSDSFGDGSADVRIFQVAYPVIYGLCLIWWWWVTWPFSKSLRWMELMQVINSKLQETAQRSPHLETTTLYKDILRKIAICGVEKPQREDRIEILKFYFQLRSWNPSFMWLFYAGKSVQFFFSDESLVFYLYNLVFSLAGNHSSSQLFS